MLSWGEKFFSVYEFYILIFMSIYVFVDYNMRKGVKKGVNKVLSGEEEKEDRKLYLLWM